MTRIEEDLEKLRKRFGDDLVVRLLPSGAQLIEVRNYKLVPGWSQPVVTVIFVAPPAFPAAQPDCFWVEPGQLRLENGGTPQNTNDSNPIPEVGQRGTWFSWHLQDWNPNIHSLVSYFTVIEHRLNPPR
jgi:Prokaryotic E2 family E